MNRLIRHIRPWPAALASTALVWIGLLALPGAVSAQANAGGGLPEALRGINPANGACRRDDSVTGASGAAVATPAQPEPDLSCAIAASDVLSWLDAPDALFVDTRLPAEHAQFGIRGSVNLAALDLRTKPYLKSKRIVLFGNGKGEQENYRACAQLKRAGFTQVRVLRGGIAMWQLAQQPLVGRSMPNAAMVGLDSAEFWQEAKFDDNVVLVSPARREVQANLSFSVLLDQPSADAIKGVLEQRRKELKGAPMAAVVLVAGKEITETQLAQIRASLKPIPVLLYADSNESLTRHIAQHQAVWTAHARGPKRPACGA